MRANTARRNPNHATTPAQRPHPTTPLAVDSPHWLPRRRPVRHLARGLLAARYKSAHHTVTPPQAITADDFEDNDWEDEIAQQPPKLPPVTAPPKEIPGPPLSAKPSAQTADGGQFKKHYQTYRLPGDYWHNLQKSGLNPTLLAQLEPLQTASKTRR